MPNLYIIAGCNGAGKTTASYSFMPDILNCKEFVNADEIAKGLSPFHPESMGVKAGKLLIIRVNELIKQRDDFSVETTLSAKSYAKIIKQAHEAGYIVHLIFLWLDSVKLAEKRVKQRVEQGGHNVPKDIIKRRYYAGLKNLIYLFIPICDYVAVIDNSMLPAKTVLEKRLENKTMEIFEENTWNRILQLSDFNSENV